MKRIKIIYALLLIGSVVLVSFRGGTISWLLFYFMLTIPALALLYVFYVYCRFRIGQGVARYVNKGEAIPYRLEYANEDLLLMTGIVLNFYTDTVKVMKRNSDGTLIPYEQEQESLSLLPHQKKDAELELYCKFRGTYPIGVKSVSVTDFFGLFTVTYPMMSQVRLTARPRILTLAQLQSRLEKRDPKKNRPSAANLQELLGYELRKYIAGDSLRHIHWKNSARAGELLVRKQAPQELYELVIVMDCIRCNGRTEIERMQREDNIIETAVALLYDAASKKVKSHIVWCTDRLCEMQIDNLKGFDRFYNLSAELPFTSAITMEEAWEVCERKMRGNPAFWLIGCDVSPELSRKVEKSRKSGKDVVLIDTGEEPL